jgi:hypothetical protein
METLPIKRRASNRPKINPEEGLKMEVIIRQKVFFFDLKTAYFRVY